MFSAPPPNAVRSSGSGASHRRLRRSAIRSGRLGEFAALGECGPP